MPSVTFYRPSKLLGPTQTEGKQNRFLPLNGKYLKLFATIFFLQHCISKISLLPENAVLSELPIQGGHILLKKASERQIICRAPSEAQYKSI